MIYNDSYFNEELRKSYIESNTSKLRLLSLCVIISLFSIIVSSFFLLMQETILGESFKHFITRNFFGLSNLYNTVVYLFFIFYLLSRYRSITFAEINKNRWYMLKKMGYSSGDIVFSKQITTIIMVAVLYLGGFLITLLLGTALQYTIKLGTLLPMIFIGFIQVSYIVSFIMMVSLYAKKPSTALWLSVAAGIMQIIVFLIAEFQDIVRDTIYVQTSRLIFASAHSIYTYYLIGCIILFVLISSFAGKSKADFYFSKAKKVDNIFIVDYKTEKTVEVDYSKVEKRKKRVKAVIYSLFVFIFFLGIMANAFLLFVGGNDENDEFNIQGYIPIIFTSRTMKGVIEMNDFTVFQQTYYVEEYSVGDVVLYHKNDTQYITQIIGDNGNGTFETDISYYPEGAEEDSMHHNLDASMFEARMVYKNRWLGAWFLLNNSLAGRVVILGVPILIVAFYDTVGKVLAFLGEHLGLRDEDDR